MSRPQQKFDGLGLAEIRRLPDSQMTKAQKLALYGAGNPNSMKYRVLERDGKQLLVNREFKPGEEIPDGWEDSPAVFGIETAPAAAQTSDEGYDSVLGEDNATVAAPAAVPELVTHAPKKHAKAK